MTVTGITFLDCLDEEVKKAPAEIQAGLKEIFGNVVIQSVLSKKDFIPTFWEMKEKIAEDLFYIALNYISRALKWAEAEVIGEVNETKVIVLRDGRFYEIYVEKNGKKVWIATYLGKWAYQRAKTILKRLQRGVKA